MGMGEVEQVRRGTRQIVRYIMIQGASSVAHRRPRPYPLTAPLQRPRLPHRWYALPPSAPESVLQPHRTHDRPEPPERTHSRCTPTLALAACWRGRKNVLVHVHTNISDEMVVVVVRGTPPHLTLRRRHQIA